MYYTSSFDSAWWDRFRELLDGQNEWPAPYLFKFIVPRSGLEELKDVFGEHPVVVRASTRGRYVSVTAKIEMGSSDEVIEVYQAAGTVDGVIAL
ncbi:MAG TPA: DUF493 family protein [Rhodothermales bacterium]|nr:DUF493 family protein [Rhodothermales bacterium]